MSTCNADLWELELAVVAAGSFHGRRRRPPDSYVVSADLTGASDDGSINKKLGWISKG